MQPSGSTIAAAAGVMHNSAGMTRTQLKTLIIGVSLFALVGSVLGVIVDAPSWLEVRDGLALGATVGVIVMLMELLVFPSPALRLIRRLPLAVNALIRLTAWCLVIVGTVTLLGPPPEDPEWITSIAASLLLTLLAVGFITIQRIVGQSALINLLTGRYYRPRSGDFAFLLIDLRGSTAIAERIGNRRFFSFLDRFLADACEPIRAHGGEVYKFVGDEIIASWPADRGADLTDCLLCWARLMRLFETLGPAYESAFGARPELRAALHVGTVTIGQIGSYKQEIAMLGEPLNAAARILELAGRLDHALILSDAAKRRVARPDGFRFEAIDSGPLRGSQEDLGLHAVIRDPA